MNVTNSYAPFFKIQECNYNTLVLVVDNTLVLSLYFIITNNSCPLTNVIFKPEYNIYFHCILYGNGPRMNASSCLFVPGLKVATSHFLIHIICLYNQRFLRSKWKMEMVPCVSNTKINIHSWIKHLTKAITKTLWKTGKEIYHMDPLFPLRLLVAWWSI